MVNTGVPAQTGGDALPPHHLALCKHAPKLRVRSGGILQMAKDAKKNL